MSEIKIAETDYPILNIIKQRWSARSFSDKTIAEDTLLTIFEAARWAASANNEQPWQYVFAQHGSEGFDKIWNCLMPGNQPWAKNASHLIVAIARKSYEANQNPNSWAEHDLGMANAHVLLQAISLDIYSHPMAGFNKDKLIDTLNLTNDQNPICIIAMGYLDKPESLEEPFKTREITKRSRKQVSDFIKKI